MVIFVLVKNFFLEGGVTDCEYVRYRNFELGTRDRDVIAFWRPVRSLVTNGAFLKKMTFLCLYNMAGQGYL